MKRKYIDDLGIKFEDTPQGFCPNDKREERWKEQRETYGFDDRETWSLDFTIKLFLYERLCMYNEINIVDTSYNKFDFNGESLTFQECINRMIEGLKLDITIDEWDRSRIDDGLIKKKIDEWAHIFALCRNALWW